MTLSFHLEYINLHNLIFIILIKTFIKVKKKKKHVIDP